MTSITRKAQRSKKKAAKILKVGILLSYDESGGTAYFRAGVVKRYLNARSDVVTLYTHTIVPDLMDCDVVYLVLPNPDNVPVWFVEKLKENKIAIIVDVDDNLFQVPEWNPAYRRFSSEESITYYRKIYSLANVITTPSKCFALDLQAENPNSSVKVIENAFDTHFRIWRATGKLGKD